MSFSAVQWAYSLSLGKSSYKAVVVALAYKLNDESGQCNPSVDTLAEMTDLNRKTVMPALDWLRTEGVISFDPRNRRGRNYTLNLDSYSPKNGTLNKQGDASRIPEQSPKNGTEVYSPKNGNLKSQKRPNKVPKTGHDKKEKKRKKYIYTSEHRKFAEWMWQKIQAKTQSKKSPNYDIWSDDIRKLNEIDGRDLRLAVDVFKWAHSDSFWVSHIQSPAKLRDKFDTLFTQFQGASNGRSQKNHAPVRKLSAGERVRELARQRAAESGEPIAGVVVGNG